MRGTSLRRIPANIIPGSSGARSTRERAAPSHRNVVLVLQRLAGPVLSGRGRSGQLSGPLRDPFRHRRVRRDLLPDPVGKDGRRLARSHPGGVSLFGQAPSGDQPRARPRRLRQGAFGVRHGHVADGRQARSDPRAIRLRGEGEGSRGIRHRPLVRLEAFGLPREVAEGPSPCGGGAERHVDRSAAPGSPARARRRARDLRVLHDAGPGAVVRRQRSADGRLQLRPLHRRSQADGRNRREAEGRRQAQVRVERHRGRPRRRDEALGRDHQDEGEIAGARLLQQSLRRLRPRLRAPVPRSVGAELIHVDRIKRRFGPRVIFENLSWLIPKSARWGLVGPNGAGKTTLLRILSGEDTQDEGEIHRTGTVRVGYLAQDVETVDGGSVLATVLDGFGEIRRMEEQLESLEHRMAARKAGDAELDKLQTAYGDLRHRFESLGGDRVEAKAGMILSGLGVPVERFHEPLTELSGGWRMRVALARLLLSAPELLLLDEPTNHLDLAAIDWLERFLSGWEGAFIVVSHDRYFLNRMVTGIVELDRGRLTEFPGAYDDYLAARSARIEALEEAAKLQAKEIARVTTFIERFR